MSAVLDYLVRLRTLTTAERARIDPAACCRVDKGGGEATPLDLEAFLVAGMSHYVHVPAVLIPRYDRTVSNVGVREGLFVVNSCSDILARG